MQEAFVVYFVLCFSFGFVRDHFKQLNFADEENAYYYSRTSTGKNSVQWWELKLLFEHANEEWVCGVVVVQRCKKKLS